MSGRMRLSVLAVAMSLATSLGGCGFTPLYDRGPDSPLADLPAIYVANIPEGRTGQEFRQALQLRLNSPVSGGAAQYQLSAYLTQSANGIGVQPDNSATYNRITGSASWTLSTVGVFPKTLASGNASTLDGYNNFDFQYFVGQIEGETATNRIAGNLADEIALQLAVWFKRHNGTQRLAAAR